MTMIPGITVRKDEQGRITHITIDVAQQQELAQPLLDKLEKKTKFREDFEKGLTVEESRRNMIEHIRKFYENKH